MHEQFQYEKQSKESRMRRQRDNMMTLTQTEAVDVLCIINHFIRSKYSTVVFTNQ